MDTSDSAVLLRRAKSGDREALNALVERLRPYVRVIVRAAGGGRFPAARDESDLMQDVLFQVSRSLPTFRGGNVGELVAWIRTITIRVTRRQLGSGAAQNAKAVGELEIADVPASLDPTPSAVAMHRELAARMADALNRLPQDMQSLLVERIVSGLSHAEIAERRQCSAGAVRMQFLRALRDSVRYANNRRNGPFDGGPFALRVAGLCESPPDLSGDFSQTTMATSPNHHDADLAEFLDFALRALQADGPVGLDELAERGRIAGDEGRLLLRTLSDLVRAADDWRDAAETVAMWDCDTNCSKEQPTEEVCADDRGGGGQQDDTQCGK